MTFLLTPGVVVLKLFLLFLCIVFVSWGQERFRCAPGPDQLFMPPYLLGVVCGLLAVLYGNFP